MKKSQFSGAPLVSILRSPDAGTPVSELCRKQGISEAACYKWKSRYAGMVASDLNPVSQLEAESAKLKRVCAALALEA